MYEDDLKREIEVLSRRVQPVPPDLVEVQRNGRRRMWTRRAGVGLLGCALVTATAVGISNAPYFAREVGGSLRPDGYVAPAAGAAFGQPASMNPRVATFGVRAVAQAGLLDPTGDFNDYERVQPVSGGAAWLVSFDTSTCDASTNCEPNPDGDVELRVEIDRGEMFVSEVTGPMDDESRERVLSYREEPTPENVGLEFPVVRIEGTPDEGISVVTSPLWRGRLSDADGPVDCHVEVYDENGETIYTGPTTEQPKPSSESMRAGTQHIFGVPAEKVTGEPASAAVLCEDP